MDEKVQNVKAEVVNLVGISFLFEEHRHELQKQASSCFSVLWTFLLKYLLRGSYFDKNFV